MDSLPLVEVLMVTYNHKNYISQAVNSALMQKTSFNYNIIIGDDCSTDGTIEILKEYEKKFPDKIKVTYQEKNLGPYHPERNIVIMLNKAKAKYVALLDGDDYWTDELKLEKQVEFMELNPDCSITFHDSTSIDDNGNIVQTSGLKENYSNVSSEKLRLGTYLPPNTVCFRKVFEKIPASFSKVGNGDTFLFSLLGEYGNACFVSGIKNAVYRVHKGGIWSLQSEIQHDCMLINTAREIYLKERNTPLAQKARQKYVFLLNKLLDNYKYNDIRRWLIFAKRIFLLLLNCEYKVAISFLKFELINLNRK